MTSEPPVSTLSPNRPETELLLCCARTRLDAERAGQVQQLLRKSLDWAFLLQAALHHGVLPLLYCNLNSLCPENVPQTMLSQLKAAFGAIALKNLHLTGELLILLSLFRDRRIRALSFKGPVLATTVYRNLSFRHFGDLDILVPQEDFPRAKEALLRQGYEPMLQLTTRQEAVYLRSHHEYPFVRYRDGIVVELQWEITQQTFAFPLDFEKVWRRREPVFLTKTRVDTLNIEDLLLVLCVHGAKHRWGQLKWICDIAELVDVHRQRIAWGLLIDNAHTQGGERMVLLGLSLARDLLGTTLPEIILQKIHNDPQLQFLTGQVYKQLFCEPSVSTHLSDEPFFFYLTVRERLQDKVAILWKYCPAYFLRAVVPNEKDKAFWRLPVSLSAGYYLIRPVRLAQQHWSHFWRRSSNTKNTSAR